MPKQIVNQYNSSASPATLPRACGPCACGERAVVLPLHLGDNPHVLQPRPAQQGPHPRLGHDHPPGLRHTRRVRSCVLLLFFSVLSLKFRMIVCLKTSLCVASLDEVPGFSFSIRWLRMKRTLLSLTANQASARARRHTRLGRRRVPCGTRQE